MNDPKTIDEKLDSEQALPLRDACSGPKQTSNDEGSAQDLQIEGKRRVCDLQVELKPRDVPPSNLQTRY